eukprot:6428904-Amphidinium_carterae.1
MRQLVRIIPKPTQVAIQKLCMVPHKAGPSFASCELPCTQASSYLANHKAEFLEATASRTFERPQDGVWTKFRGMKTHRKAAKYLKSNGLPPPVHVWTPLSKGLKKAIM